MTKQRKFFLSFGDSRMHRSARRLRAQANKMQYYDEVKIYDERALNNQFYNRFKSKLVLGSRGFGYWCWKPQIILQLLNEMKENDLLQYSDIGCHLNPNGIDRLNYYFNMTDVSKTAVFAFKSVAPKYPLVYDQRKLLDLVEYKWTKGDLFDYFNIRNNTNITHTQSYGATNLFLKKCTKSINFIQEWLEVIYSNFSLIDNSQSNSPNFPGFVEHRHDQSILSILCKKYNVSFASSYEYWYPKAQNPYKPDWKSLNSFPIHKKRDKNLGFINQIYEFFLKIKNKIFPHDIRY